MLLCFGIESYDIARWHEMLSGMPPADDDTARRYAARQHAGLPHDEISRRGVMSTLSYSSIRISISLIASRAFRFQAADLHIFSIVGSLLHGFIPSPHVAKDDIFDADISMTIRYFVSFFFDYYASLSAASSFSTLPSESDGISPIAAN